MEFSINNILQYFNFNLSINLKIPGIIWNESKKYIKKYRYYASLISGLLIGLFEFPCTGGL
jgi:hypothetical protein